GSSLASSPLFDAQVSGGPLAACESNNLIESLANVDFESFARFVSDKAKISRKISARRSAPSSGTFIVSQTSPTRNFVFPQARFLTAETQLSGSRLLFALFGSQCCYWVHASGTVRREEAGKEGRTCEHQSCGNKRQRIARTDIIQ